MIEGKPSHTAFMTAVQRAHHHLTAPEPKILNDTLALALSGLNSIEEAEGFLEKIVASFAALSDRETAETFMKRIDGAVCMRSRVVEEQLLIARVRGVEQLVILGAGLDSSAYRCLDLTVGMQVFEVDHPSTQLWKRERLRDAKIAIPENLKFVAFDFEAQTLGEALLKGGVSQSKVTFFTWLGVQMYLTDDAVRSTLGMLGAYPEGSELIMDYISKNYVAAGGMAEKSVDYLQNIVSDMGEPIKSKYLESELEDILNTSGFTSVKYLNAKWLVDNYLGGERSVFDMPDEATSILTAQI